jgi:hypothetical protein
VRCKRIPMSEILRHRGMLNNCIGLKSLHQTSEDVL